MQHKEEYVTHFWPKQVFDLVADIERYPEFLPWCKSARIIKKTKTYILAEISIYFAPFSYKYTSKVKFETPKTKSSTCGIKIELVEGPFDRLNNTWEFKRDKGATIVKFAIEFQASSSVLNKMLELMFDQAAHKIITAFQARAEAIYNSKS